MEMKKLICLLFITIICFNLTGCKVINGLKEVKQYEKECRIFADYVATEDRDAIYEMFSDECKDIDGFDEQFNTVLDLLYSYDLDYQNIVVDTEMCGGGESFRDGRITRWSRSPIVRNIFDSDGNEYRITFRYVGIDRDNPAMEGISALSLRTIDEKGVYARVLYIGRYTNIDHQQRFYYYPED